MTLSINGEDQDSINFWKTGGSSSWAWDRKPVFLEKGTNSVVIASTGLSPKLDHVNVLPAGSAQVYGVSKLKETLMFMDMEPEDRLEADANKIRAAQRLATFRATGIISDKNQPLK